jgi:capsular polysaccharide biosynthesis protein
MNTPRSQRPGRGRDDDSNGADPMPFIATAQVHAGARGRNGASTHPARGVHEAARPSVNRAARPLTVRRAIVAVAVALVGPAIGFAAYLSTPEVYNANAFVMIVAQPGAGEAAAVSFAQAYSRIATDPAVIASASGNAPGDKAFATSRRVATSVSPDAPLIEVSAQAGTATRAAVAANDVADSIVTYASRMRSATSVNAVLVGRAAPPPKPAGPRLVADVGLGVVGGVLLGALTLLAWPRGRADDREPGDRR